MALLKNFVAEIYPDYPYAVPDQIIGGIECDSRKVEKDFLYVAIRGNVQDGNRFIEEAIQRGAVAVVSDQQDFCLKSTVGVRVPDSRLALAKLAALYYGKPSAKIKVIGVTGTNGKTTSVYLLEHVLKKINKKTGVIGTIDAHVGHKIIPTDQTTPSPLVLQKMLAEMAASACDFVVMEVSSHALDQHRVTEIDFAGALFTNLTQDHLDYHETLEKYLACKERLFIGLGSDNFCALNNDDKRVSTVREKTRARVISYGIHSKSDIVAKNILLSRTGTQFEVAFEDRTFQMASPMIGLHNVYNILGVLAILHGLGLDIREFARSAFLDFKGAPGRLEEVEGGQNFSVFVDFAHTPDGLKNVLESLKALQKKRLIVVFGCGGNRDKSKRPLMGGIAAHYCDKVYVTSDNPRNENPAVIANEVCAGFGGNFKNYQVVLDRKKAIRQALLEAREGDIVLLAGKGHEETQIIGDTKMDFNDKREALEVLDGH